MNIKANKYKLLVSLVAGSLFLIPMGPEARAKTKAKSGLGDSAKQEYKKPAPLKITKKAPYRFELIKRETDKNQYDYLYMRFYRTDRKKIELAKLVYSFVLSEKKLFDPRWIYPWANQMKPQIEWFVVKELSSVWEKKKGFPNYVLILKIKQSLYTDRYLKPAILIEEATAGQKKQQWVIGLEKANKNYAVEETKKTQKK